ncbi:MAG TPA: PGF-pre-PGF domain-containing protein [Candidatus Methanoperedens sp.]
MAKHKTQKKPFIASTLITLVIVVMLIISGPVQAVLVTISGLQGTYTKGSGIEFQVQIDINDPDQFVPMKDVSLNLTGPASPSAVFALDGKFLSGDSSIRISPVQIPKFPDFGYGYGFGSDFGYGYGYGYGTGDFGFGYGYGYGQRYDFGYGFGYGYMAGYGYGYGYGNLTYIYKVSIDTTNLPVGDYDVVASLDTGKTAIPAFTPGVKFTSGTGHFTLTEAPPSPAGGTGGGGGGGTGSGGVISSEPFDNIEIAETKEMDLTANLAATYKFSIVPRIYEIVLTDNESENDVAIRVEALKGTSKRVTASPEGIVSKNINILAGTKRFKEALVRFKVDNSWIDSNGLESGDVVMVKWDGTKWVQLETTETNKDGNYTYYEVKTESFSNFAITGLKGAVTTPSVTPGIIPVTPGPTAVPGTTGVTPPVPGAAPPVTLALIILGVVILIAIVVALYMRRK